MTLVRRVGARPSKGRCTARTLEDPGVPWDYEGYEDWYWLLTGGTFI